MYNGGQNFRHIYAEEYQFGSEVDQAMNEGYVPYGNITAIDKPNLNTYYSICMVKVDILNSMDLMTQVMKLHPQLEEEILKNA